MVLGHTSCGAVKAALADEELEGHLPRLAKTIKEAVLITRDGSGDLLDQTIRTHAKLTAENLCGSKHVLKNLVDSGRLLVVPAYYDLRTGLVESSNHSPELTT